MPGPLQSPVALKAAAVFQSAFQSLRTRLQKFCADTEAATADGASFQQKLKCAACTTARLVCRECMHLQLMLMLLSLTLSGRSGDGMHVSGRFGSAALPLLASAAGVNSTLPLITSAVASFIKLYLLLLFVRVLLTW